MGGMDNKTSVGISRAKQDSKNYHAKRNNDLYKEYLNSGSQYTCSFNDWKQTNKKKKKPEKMQRPLSKKELQDRGYNTKTLNQTCRWK
jgi:hypothetical protein